MKNTEHYKILQKARGFKISLLIKWKFQHMWTENLQLFCGF